MKQMVLFEPHDLATLKRGESLTLRVGDTEVTLGYAGTRSSNHVRPRGLVEQTEFLCQVPACPRSQPGHGFSKRPLRSQHQIRAHKFFTRPATSVAMRAHKEDARTRYRAVIAHAYGTTRCSVCKQPKTDLRLFPATLEGWRPPRLSNWKAIRQVATLLEEQGMTATKKLWHFGCRACMRAGANAAREKGED